MICKATKADIEEIRKLYANAKVTMHANGNPTQWVNGYPESCIESDIANEVLYVGRDQNHMLYLVFALIEGKEETYATIEGAWMNANPYVTIHRIASNGRYSNVLQEAVEFAFKKADTIRIDTHQDNIPMRKALDKNGFLYCGIIHLADGSPRNAYAKTQK